MAQGQIGRYALLIAWVCILASATACLMYRNQVLMDHVAQIFKASDAGKVQGFPLTYVTLSEGHLEPYIHHMARQGWAWGEAEQLGSRNCFKRGDEYQYFDVHHRYPLAFWVLVP